MRILLAVLFFCSTLMDGAMAYNPVNGLGMPTLPFTMEGDVKVFKLRAEPVVTRFCSMEKICKSNLTWGYNGVTPGPVIEAVEGDKIRIEFTNGLQMHTAVHWHGLELPNAMDGGGMHTQRLVQPGETFNYEFTLEQSGTFLYHSGHMQSLQVGMGQAGFFIAHPKKEEHPVDHDYLMMLQIWSIPPHDQIPDTMSMEFNWFTINGKVGPDVPHLRAMSGEKIRVRIANLSMMSHPIHLHGHTFWIVEDGGGRNPESAHTRANTISLSAGESKTVEFHASKHPGPWLFHCHFLHHIMNDMDRPPVPGEKMIMAKEAGMFTVLDVESGSAEKK